MANIYTLAAYLVIGFFIRNLSCFVLDIGKTSKHYSDEGEIGVNRVKDNLDLFVYTFENPLTLEKIKHGNKHLYFDYAVTKDQLLASASVLWTDSVPTVVQLNFDKSSVILSNEKNSFLSVQAIFSDKTVTNIQPVPHYTDQTAVDVDLSKNESYQNNSRTVRVSTYKLEDRRLRRIQVRYYDLEIYKLGNILFDIRSILSQTRLITKPSFVTNWPIPSNYKSPIDVENKEDVTGVKSYCFVSFPLVLEIMYGYNKRKFLVFTPSKQWHVHTLPSPSDPSYMDRLVNLINYVACKNKLNFTINIGQKHGETDKPYTIENHCVLNGDVKTVENTSYLAFYTDSNSNLRCFEHIPEHGNRIFFNRLMDDGSVVELKLLPDVVDVVRVYHDLTRRAYVMTLITPGRHVFYYIYDNKAWKFHRITKINVITDRFSDMIRSLIQEMKDVDMQKGRRVPSLKVPNDVINLMGDRVKFFSLHKYECVTDTLKRDTHNRQLTTAKFDVWYYTSHYYETNYNGSLSDILDVDARENRAMNPILYWTYNIHKFVDKINSHKVVYHYDSNTYDMTVDIYTNALFVYTFRKNYYEDATTSWKFLEIKPMTILQNFEMYKKYFTKMNELNSFEFDVEEYTTNPLDLIPRKAKVKFGGYFVEFDDVPTIAHDIPNMDKIKKFEFDVKRPFDKDECLIYTNGSRDGISIITTDNCAINKIKYEGNLIIEMGGDVLVRRVEFRQSKNPVLSVLNIYTNTLLHYEYVNEYEYYTEDYWKLKSTNNMNVILSNEDDKAKAERFFVFARHLKSFRFTK